MVLVDLKFPLVPCSGRASSDAAPLTHLHFHFTSYHSKAAKTHCFVLKEVRLGPNEVCLWTYDNPSVY